MGLSAIRDGGGAYLAEARTTGEPMGEMEDKLGVSLA